MEHKFIKQSPCCGSELSITYDTDEEKVFVECLKKSKSAKAAEKEAEIPAALVQANVRRCDYCFNRAIAGGHLCSEHSFCGKCDKDIADGVDRAHKYKKLPRCVNCATED